MDKNEILRKAQEQKGLDEREMQVARRGSEIAMWGGLILCVAIMVCKMIVKQPWQDLYSVYCTMVAILHFYKWRCLREQHNLLMGILWAAVAAFLIAVYFFKLFR